MNRAFTTLLLLPLILAMPARAPADARVLVEHWPPWLVAQDPERKMVTDGAGVDLVREIFNRLDVAFEFRNVPWQRALVQLEEGAADAMPLMSQTRDRSRYLAFTEPLYTDELILVTAAGDNTKAACDWSRPGALTGRTVGTVRDYVYGKQWAAFAEKHGFVTAEANNDLTNLKKVAGGRLDFTVQYHSFVKSSVANDNVPADKLAICPEPIERIPLRLGISRQSPLADRLDEFNRVLRSMKEDGTYRRILGDLHPDRSPVALSITP